MAMVGSFSQGNSLDNRVEDFLDDKLQSTTDLDSLDQLLANVEIQRNQLQSQLDDAVKELDQARRMTGNSQTDLETRIQEFQDLQESIDRRDKIYAASDAPDQAIARLQGPLSQWRAVKLAQKYLVLLQDVDKWRVEARSHLPESPKAALEPYSKLKQLVSTLRELQGEEELHLVAYVDGVTESLWIEMKKTMSAELEVVLKKRTWPKVNPQSQMDDEWIACIEKLVDLQVPEVVYSKAPVALLPLDIMSKIFAAEFRFHFLSDKPTSDPQAIGTHCFPWFIATIEKWEEFFRDNLGHLLAAKFSDTTVATNLLYIDPVSAFITAMLPVMREKVQSVADKAAKNASFLSNFISQLMTFDDELRSKFNYDGGDSDRGWAGLTTEVLQDLFETWFTAEKDFALKRFNTILDSEDARKIDYDYAADGRMKPTFAAVQIMDLLSNVTNQYKRLRKVKQKTRFLIQIQLDILDEYDARLRGSLELYQSVTSTIGRTLHGVSKEQMAAVQGTGALDVLCRVLGSADHVMSTLKEWSNEEFFLEFWEQLQQGSSSSKAQDLSFDEVKGRTSSVMGQGGEDGALFDEMVADYSRRRLAAQDLLTAAVVDSHSKASKTYSTRAQFTTIDNSSSLDHDQLNVSPDLAELLDVLKRNFDFLRQVLSTATYRRVFREALTKLHDQLWHDILLRQSFTTFGAAQFQHDVSAICSLVDQYIPSGSSALGNLREGTSLLNLSVEGEGLTLKQASDRLFMDNSEARAVLEELGLEALTPQNARNILQRRVENSDDVDW